MADHLSEIIPVPEDLLALEPEELAGVIMEFFNSNPDIQSSGFLHADAFCGERGLEGYPPGHNAQISQALMEAWVWLEREGLVAKQPGGGSGWCFITRRGKRIKSQDDLASYRNASILPRGILHPLIGQKVWPLFIRGEYDTAIFLSYKEVEVAVRNAAGFSADHLGVALMREAFDKTKGPLADHSLPEAEREAMSHLFAGAIGLYKNPQSHRDVSTTDPSKVVPLVLFASHLMDLVERKRIQ